MNARLTTLFTSFVMSDNLSIDEISKDIENIGDLQRKCLQLEVWTFIKIESWVVEPLLLLCSQGRSTIYFFIGCTKGRAVRNMFHKWRRLRIFLQVIYLFKESPCWYIFCRYQNLHRDQPVWIWPFPNYVTLLSSCTSLVSSVILSLDQFVSNRGYGWIMPWAPQKKLIQMI